MFTTTATIIGQSPFSSLLDRNRERNMVFYGRVSTEHEAQLSALENQIQWYDDQARLHSNWNMLNKYIDEGITGTQARKRPAFLKMLEDARQGKFDLIVTREVCRFARNTVDTLVTTRELKNLGIEVYFVEDNIWTMDGDGELRLTIMATLAQEESRKVSERVKAGQHISRTNGVVYGTGNILGYDRVDGNYVINEEQAETVRMIYDMYLNKDMGATKIANELCRRRKIGANGEIKWNSSNISRILSNQTYIGYMAYGKSFSNNYLEQKRINNHNKETYMYVKADFEPIISEEDWKKCEAIRNSRRKVIESRTKSNSLFQQNNPTVAKRESHDLWTKKLKCSCGSSFRKNRWHKNKNKEWSYGYQCYHQLNHGSAKKRREQGLDDTGYCDMQMVADWKLDVMGKMLIEQLWSNRKDAVNIACDILKKCYQADTSIKHLGVSIQEKIDKVNTKIENLIDMRADGDITKDEYRTRRQKLDDELVFYQSELEEQEQDTDIVHSNGLQWDTICATLSEIIDFSQPHIDAAVFDRFVSAIIPKGDNHYVWIMNLDGKEQADYIMDVAGRKNNHSVCIMDEEEKEDNESSSIHIADMLHISDIGAFIKGKKSSLTPTQHRRHWLQGQRSKSL